MNLIQRAVTSLYKLMSGKQWKAGTIWSDYSTDKGITQPFKQSTLVYVAVSKISENLPQAPLEFIKIENNQRLTYDSPLVKLFSKPNEFQTYFTFFEELTLFLALYGETFIWVGESFGQRAGTSTMPGQLVVINPTKLQHVVNENGLAGWIYDNGRERVALTKEEILQIKFPNPYDPFRGFSPLDSGMHDADTDYLASKFSKAFFLNSANPSIVFTLPEDDESSDEQRKELLKQWNQLRQGASKQYKAAILNPGMNIVKTGLTQEEMDYVKQRKFSEERILAIFGVPPAMAGFYEQATYGNVRTAKRIFWNETIKAYARRYESILNNFFLPNIMPGVKCKFNFSVIDELKHDAKETADIINIYANHGVPMNTLIEAFELPFGEQQGLDVGYQNMTMLPVGTNFIEIQNEMASDEKSDDKKSVNTIPSIFNSFEKELHNYLYRQREKILKIHSKGTKLDDLFWKQENDRLIAKFDPIYQEYNRNITNLIKINNFNRKLIENKDSTQIRNIYNSFNKKVGKMTKSRIFAIAEKEVSEFLEQNDKGRS